MFYINMIKKQKKYKINNLINILNKKIQNNYFSK